MISICIAKINKKIQELYSINSIYKLYLFNKIQIHEAYYISSYLIYWIRFFCSEKEKEKKENEKEGLKYFYKEATVETDDYSIYIIDAVADLKKRNLK